MSLKAWHAGLFGLAAFILASLLLISSPNLSAAPTLQSPQVQASFSKPSYDPGDTAVFHVTDASLDTLFSCTATWVDADPGGETWDFETYWNIITGAPAATTYQGRGSSCAFVSTSTTPLEEFPDLASPWVANVNGQDYSITEFFDSGDATLDIPDLAATSTIAFPFYFYAQNTYPPSAQRVRVTTVADPTGEWATLAEVASTTDSTAAPKSGVFRGSVELRAGAAAVEGDGVVRIDGAGDVVQLTYYGPTGQTVVVMESAEVGGLPPSPTPTHTPTPTPLPDVAFAQPSFRPGESAVFYVTDWKLNTLSSCIATWVDADPAGEIYHQFTHWNVFTGEPAPSAYRGWDSGCGLDSTSFSYVETVPAPWLGHEWFATVNGVDAIVGEFYVEGEFVGNAGIHANNFSSSNTIKLPIYFHVHDTHPASSQRARVSSGADPTGEWVALTEVESTTEAAPAVDSGVFRGSVALRADAAAVEGDGVVSVDAGGDTLRLRYYGPSGDKVVGSSRASVLASAPTITPIPTRARRRRPTRTPTPTITPTPTPVPAVRRIATLTPTPAPTHTPAPTATHTATPRPTRTPAIAPTLTPSPTNVPSATPTPSPTISPTPTPTPTATATVTPTPTRAPTATPTVTATAVAIRPPTPAASPTATVPPLAMEETAPGGGCVRPAAAATPATALANLALLAAPLALAAGLRRGRS